MREMRWALWCQVILWDLNEETSLRVLYGPHVCGDAIDVVGDQLLAGCNPVHCYLPALLTVSSFVTPSCAVPAVS